MDKISIVTPRKGFLGKFGQFLAYGTKGLDGSIALVNNKANNTDVIIKQIITEFKNLNAKDIKDWHDSLVIAQDPFNPRWAPFMDTIDQLEPDAQLGTSKDIRVAATLGRKSIIYSKKTGEEIPEKTAIFKDKEWFFNWGWNVLDTLFYGNTPMQLLNPVTMEFSYLPRRNYIPQRNFFVFQTFGNEGYDLSDPLWADSVMVIKYKHQFGILNDIIPNLIWKKNALQAYAEFVEKFGIPPIWATSKKSDIKTIDKIEAGLKQLGQSLTAVLPEGTDIKIDESAHKGDPYNVFTQLIKINDDYIAKRLLGGTMIIDDGSSRSQSEVHERTLKEVIGLFDKMLFQFAVNNLLMPMMAKYGYPFTEDDAFKFDETEEMGLKDFGELVNKFSANYEFDIEWLNKRFGTKIIGIKNSITSPGSFNSGTTALAAALVPHGIMLPKYVGCKHHHHKQPVASFTDDMLAELSDMLINDIWEGKETLVNEVLKSIAAFRIFQKNFFDSWGERRMQLTYDATDNHCLAMMEYNLFTFSRLKEEANVFALNQLLIDKEKNNISNKTDFINQAQQYLKDPDINWLNTEINQTTAVGQNASRYHQFKSEEDKVTQWVKWQTVGDDRVRPTHAAMNGRIFNLKDSSGLTVWPPKDWGCRCEMVQYLGKPPVDLITSNDEGLKILKISDDSQWNVNRGVIEQVFTANEMYVKNKGITDNLSKLSYAAYNLKPYNDIAKNYPDLKIDKTITEENAGELFKPVGGSNYMGYKDYLKRNIILNKKVFTQHTTQQKYVNEGRHQLFPFVNEILTNPDEVYFQKSDKGTYQSNYLKFYNNKALVVNTKIGKNNLEINTWYELKDEKNVRAGYLIHKKNKS